MQYIRCLVHKHGLFDNRILNFSDRLTIVFGMNGSGKSLLARSMVDAVWRKFSDRRLLSEELWNSLYLDVLFSLSENGYFRACNTSDKSYKIYYCLNNEEKLLYAESRLDDAAARTEAGFTLGFETRILQDFLKRVDYNTFVHSSFIPSSTDVSNSSIVDYSILKKIILDDGTNFYNHSINLQEAFCNSNIDGHFPPEVMRYEEKNRELEKKIQIIDISDSRHEKLRKEKNNIQQEMDELNSSLHSLNSQKEILIKIIENLNKVDELKGEFESIKEEIQGEQQKMKSISDMKTELDTMFPQFSDMDIGDSTNLDKLQEVFNDIRNLNEQIDDFYFKRELKKKKIIRIIVAVLAGGIASVLFIMLKNKFALLKDLYLWIGISIFTGLAIIVLMIQYAIITSRNKGLERLEDEKKNFKVRIKSLLDKSKLELEDYKLTEIYELLLQYFEDYVNYTERKKDLALMKSSLKEEEYMIQIQKKLDALKKQEEIIKDEIHTSIDTLNIVDDLEHETSKIEDLILNIDMEAGLIKEKIETKERILQQIDNEFVMTSSNSISMNATIEEKNSVDRILKKWRINEYSMRFIMTVLAQAVERSEEKQLKRLLDGTLDKFNHLTGNRYITKIDEGILRQMITANIISDELTPPVIHALLISLTFTLSDFIIDGNTTIPLLIDEPFQFMDDERCNRFRELVSYISNKRQVIIFTHHSDKRNWGNFIEL